jgi:hypothetical protein
MNDSRESNGVRQTCKAHGNGRISLPRAGQGVLVAHIELKYLEETAGFVGLLAKAFEVASRASPQFTIFCGSGDTK